MKVKRKRRRKSTGTASVEPSLEPALRASEGGNFLSVIVGLDGTSIEELSTPTAASAVKRKKSKKTGLDKEVLSSAAVDALSTITPKKQRQKKMKETKSKDIEVPVLSKKELHLIDKEIR
jgi:hypothetical protein